MNTKKPAFLFSLLLAFVLSFSGANISKAEISADVQQDISEKERQIQEFEKQREEYQAQINEKQKESRTLEGEIFILDTEIKKLQLEIKTLGLAIQKTDFEINETADSIDAALSKIKRIKESLAEFLRIVYQSEQENLFEILLKNRDLSDFFGNLENIRSSQEKAQITIEELKQLKIELEEKQEELEAKRLEQIALKNIQEIQKREVNVVKKERSDILKITKGDEKKFQNLVNTTNQSIQKLREEVQFLLKQGVTLEEAIKFGHLAAIRTGIRPAFLIAVLESESALGVNVGKCYITDATSGASRNVTTGQVFTRGINPKRDLPLFIKVAQELGKDPFQTPISCWQPFYVRGVSVGWGGGMGPAQFIPSTWFLLNEDVARITGRSPPNPWNIEDAFLAAAVLLAQGGATSQTRAGEVAAAKAYFSGNPRCSRADCNSYAVIVMRKAAQIEKDLPASTALKWSHELSTNSVLLNSKGIIQLN